jgi:hypothetical protein
MMNRSSLFLLCLPACGLLVAACSSSTNTGGTATLADGGGSTVDGGGATDAPSGGTACTSARDQLLLPIDKVATAEVSVLGDSGGVRTIYVDASVGGPANAAKSPRVYVNLATGTRVDVTDKTAPQSTAWDLALKRSVLFTNSGDAGVGQGGAVQLASTFASVTAAAANAASVQKEVFFDADCNPQLDPTGAPSTTFSDWYNYDQATNIPTPKDVTYIVQGGTGLKYKVGIKAYDGLPDGGTRNNTSTGFYVLQVSAL